MSAPTPAPRKLKESKRPIPAPRTSIPIKQDPRPEENENFETMDGKNTFSRRVRTLSNASKQIAEESKKVVQDTIDATRQSVRRMTKRFTNNFTECEEIEIEKSKEINPDDINLFNSIQFNSPIHLQDPRIYNDSPSNHPIKAQALNFDESTHPTKPIQNNNPIINKSNNLQKPESIYSNDETESIYSNDPSNLQNTPPYSPQNSSLIEPFYNNDNPPPSYPPPPLREEIYDQPQSLTSGSTQSSDGLPRNLDYESVFPAYEYNSDSESCVDMTAGTIDRKVDLSRSQSWVLYDSVSVSEAVYGNVDSTPVLCVEKERKESFVRNNSLYENHILPERSLPTKSILMEFDPLMNSIPPPSLSTHSNDLSELEKNLQGELYGNDSLDNISYGEVSDDETYVKPPPPPTRFDSYSTETPIEPQKEEKSKTNWFTDSEDSASNKTESKPSQGWFNKVLKKAPELVELVKGAKVRENVVQRPSLSSKGIIQQKGMLYKIASGPVDLFGEFSSRWCVLQSGKLTCYADTCSENIKEDFPMDCIISVQILQDQKYKYRCENDELYCFELSIAGKQKSRHVYGTKISSERRVWTQKIADSLSNKFSAIITSDYTRLGWAYMKEGIGGEWCGVWLALAQRNLHYASDKTASKALDLRKARCFRLEPLQDNAITPSTTNKGPDLVIHFTFGTFYFRMWTQRETKAWCHMIKSSAQNNGPSLEGQQLTRNNIPVIVEKCVNFIYVYGSMTEGIYRRTGSSALVTDIINLFRADAWSVQLTNKYSVHDVATALKRFFCDLVEPLIDNKQMEYLYQVAKIENREEKIRMFKSVFDQLLRDSPARTVTYNTTKFLLNHLHFVSTQSQRNLMTIENLALIWAPTLLQHEITSGADNFVKEHLIVSQLITLYKDIFAQDSKETLQEQKMLSILKKYSQSPQGAVNVKASGDFRVWIHDFFKEEKTHNLLIGPNKTAYEVLCELSAKVDIPVHELVLEECVLNETLRRPIHHKEKLLDVVLKWGYWTENDRKDNRLIMKKLSCYSEYINDNALPLQAELKFADTKMKNAKSSTFEFLHSKLTYYKDKSCSVKVDSWNIEDITWYLGHETKRGVPTKYTITFLKKSDNATRTKSSPWFGNVLCWNDPTLQAIWLSTMWKAEHQNDIRPPPQYVNLMNG